MAMQAGTLRHRVEIVEPITTQDEFGQPITTWVPFATRWADIDPLRGTERWAAQQVNAELTIRVTMRWIDGLSPQMRIRHRGRELRINSILDPGERREMVEIMCTEFA